MKTATAKSDTKKRNDNGIVFSYLTLRNLIGLGGMLLPLMLAIFPRRMGEYYKIEPSISDYFYTDRGDILVVILCVLGAFLVTYAGYTWQERGLTFLAGFCGMGVAFVPTHVACGNCDFSVHTDHGGLFPTIAGTWWHFAFAATFLFSLAIMSLVFFTKSSIAGDHRKADGSLTQKGKRNIVYKICGWIIIASLVVLALFFVIKPDVSHFPVVFTFETIAIEAFGFSWLVKGETIWPDGEHYLVTGIKEMLGK